MLTKNFYEKILIEPLFNNNSRLNRLCIVSGYATSAMGFHYLNDLREREKNINLELIVGMTSRDGLSLSNHNGFKTLVTEEFQETFRCSYVVERPPVHSKLYVWCEGSAPKVAFVGSANYTQTALRLKTQKEIMTQCDPSLGYEYFNSLVSQTIYCQHPDAEQRIIIYRDSLRQYRNRRAKVDSDIVEKDSTKEYSGLRSVTTDSLISLKGSSASGLNWGQRLGRNSNQAYIRLTSDIYRANFFPPRATHFTLLTDDDKTLICTRAQENGKAIHTPQNNSLMGEYFRNRLGVVSGEPVLMEHLEKYGRKGVTFYKIDDETYYMDFSVK